MQFIYLSFQCNSYFSFHAIHTTLSIQYLHLSFQCSSYSTFNAIHIFLLLLFYSCCIVLFFWSLFVKSYKSVSDSPVNHVIYVQTYPQFYATRVSHIDLVKAQLYSSGQSNHIIPIIFNHIRQVICLGQSSIG